jgi:hypothetical protein
MARSEAKPNRKRGGKSDNRGKLSLYGLSIEDALRAAAQTGRPPPIPNRTNRQRKKQTKLGAEGTARKPQPKE